MDFDCVIIGAGPSGLHTGTYMGRFCRKTLIFDGWKPRAEWIPVTNNYPGFPDGISGIDLIELLKKQCNAVGTEIRQEHVKSISGRDGDFLVIGSKSEVTARKIVFATGVTDIPPKIPNPARYKANLIRHCPICDAYEARGKRMVVFGYGDRGARHTIWLAHYANDLTMLTCGLSKPEDINPELRHLLGMLNIPVYDSPVKSIEDNGEILGTIILEDGIQIENIYRGYSAMGLIANSSLAKSIGVEMDSDGFIITDNSQSTNIKGIYAVGDIVSGEIAQISIAVGHASTAAVSIHNSMMII